MASDRNKYRQYYFSDYTLGMLTAMKEYWRDLYGFEVTLSQVFRYAVHVFRSGGGAVPMQPFEKRALKAGYPIKFLLPDSQHEKVRALIEEMELPSNVALHIIISSIHRVMRLAHYRKLSRSLEESHVDKRPN